MAEGLTRPVEQTGEIVGAFAKWPPEPPIGQLKAETLTLKGKGGDEEKQMLYALIGERYGLKKDEMW